MLDSRKYWAREFRLFRTETLAKKLVEIEKLARELICEFKEKQWKEFLDRQGDNPLSSVPFWKRINRLRENKRRSRIASLCIRGNTVDSDVGIANLFAENLEEKFKKDSNPNFNTEHEKNVEEFVNSENFESSFTQAQKIIPIFNMRELVKNMKDILEIY